LAFRLEKLREPLALRDCAPPLLEPGQLRVRVEACAVCRTDLHLIDGEVPARLPVTPGHEVVGTVEETRAPDASFAVGDRVGIPWLAATCGACHYCRSGRENLCERARFTGCDVDGGFAEIATADARFVLPIPERYDAAHAAPLLCAGLIGYRAYRFAEDPEALGLYGFGAAAHIVAQMAVAEGRRVFAFTRPGDRDGQAFARELGAVWAGGSDVSPPEPLDSAILFAPVGALVPRALAAVRPGGRVVCAGIHMSEIPAFSYDLLWRERSILSVANLTRADGIEFMRFVDRFPVETHVTRFPLTSANEAVTALRTGDLRGAAVLLP
jgi:propanol-preferring alcohol dehydrogenase